MRNKYVLSEQIKKLGLDFGFDNVQITTPSLTRPQMQLERWLKLDNHGEMDYLAKHGLKRSDINLIHPKTLSVICVSKNYLSESIYDAKIALNQNNKAYISLYARNKDYHKLMRSQMTKFAKGIDMLIAKYDLEKSSFEQVSSNELDNNIRVFVDSAPVMEKALAEKSGIGFMGKNTNIINVKQGSLFFLGEIAISIDLIAISSYPEKQGSCGSCRRCIDICPTKAIVAPYQLNAELCISYLTIEYKGIIADNLKPMIGNRIFGCDDCQLFCPWNKFAKMSSDTSFHAKESLKNTDLLTLFNWTESEFLENTINSPIRRTGYEMWKRNIAIAIGNWSKSMQNDIGNNINNIKLISDNNSILTQCKSNNNIVNEALIDAINWAILK